mgnify:CR=1 FL=1
MLRCGECRRTTVADRSLRADGRMKRIFRSGASGRRLLYRKFDQLVIRDTGRGPVELPISIQGSWDFGSSPSPLERRAVRAANLNMFDAHLKDNTTRGPFIRLGGRVTASDPLSVRPVPATTVEMSFRSSSQTRRIRTSGSRRSRSNAPASLTEIRDLVVYRGDDVAPPAAPTELTAQYAGAPPCAGVAGARDNVSVAV